MNAFDFSPLFRSGVGFDRLARLAEATLRHSGEQATSWPPYNIEKTGEDSYAITLAVAGFPENDLDVEVHDDLLVVRGNRSPLAGDTDATPNDGDQGERRYLHRGIAFRGFVRHFQLADHMTVTGAHLENGLLTITLVREVPEASKPRHIAIATAAKTLPSAA
ncbi:Hsp20 family protein [Haematospirillum sp. 15-248]|uniref:Hsp20 family protein n=1 Tax=Haematospirillum sp. 15-248 TaxID=2723107 RepID=UPI00143AEA35|nr:Hsp20 family protein [Haematospirillum sp. 15-248]NKD88054.1 Hsp20 family protein [Haematospirillum sp. 15-248]